MTARVTAPYGAWPSPISAADVARAGVQLSFPHAAGGQVWWQEIRPGSGGRATVACRPLGEGPAGTDATPRALLDPPWHPRTRVMEYGGRSYLPVTAGAAAGGLVFAHYDDQRLYLARGTEAAEPVPLTPDPVAVTGTATGLRYADLVPAPDSSVIWCVRERHTGGAVSRAIVAIPLDGSAADDPDAITELVTGADFFAAPTPSPDGRHLAWISWNHPNMPWDGSLLRVAPIAADGSVGPARTLKGGVKESVLAPGWRDATRLYVVSDWSGWWNLYQVSLDGEPTQALYPAEEEFAGPMWRLGGMPYVPLADGRIAVTHGQGGNRLGLLDPDTAEITDFELPYTSWTGALCATGSTLIGIAAGPAEPHAVVAVDIDGGAARTLRREFDDLPDARYLPEPRPITVESQFGSTVHAIVYPPTNPDAAAPAGELPPYVVWVHGGPTAHVTAVFDLAKAYFTSRGIGVVDVNHGGSTGYGRHYRERLRGRWGVVDVEDSVAAAQALVAAGEADPDRLAIRGGSAGGWTTLVAVTSTDAFAAGVSYYGICDMRRFVAETHDFESRYLDGLIGPLPGFARAYDERSPINRLDRIACPVLLLQGLDDPIVPPAQSEMFADAMARAGIRHAYLAFAGEAHGFRKAATLTACLEAELSFYGQILGFTPPGVPELALRSEPAG